MTDTNLIDDFIQSRKTMNGDRSLTNTRRERICRSWQVFLENKRGRTISNANAEDLLAFVVHRQKDGVKDTTIRGELCVIRTFYEHLLARGKVLWSPAVSLPQMICDPPAEKTHLTVNECLSILSSLDTKETVSMRNYVIVALLWSTGLRNRELCALSWQDVDLEDGSLLVREGKGGKQRQLFLNDRIVSDLKTYRKRLGAAWHDPVFCSSKPGTKAPLSSSRLVQVCRECAREAGIDKAVNPLTFRHTFATHMFEAGVDLEDLKEMMGHCHVTETTVYVHISLDAAKQILNDHISNPRKYS
jgi:site-specific recombinase XerD